MILFVQAYILALTALGKYFMCEADFISSRNRYLDMFKRQLAMLQLLVIVSEMYIHVIERTVFVC